MPTWMDMMDMIWAGCLHRDCHVAHAAGNDGGHPSTGSGRMGGSGLTQPSPIEGEGDLGGLRTILRLAQDERGRGGRPGLPRR